VPAVQRVWCSSSGTKDTGRSGVRVRKVEDRRADGDGSVVSKGSVWNGGVVKDSNAYSSEDSIQRVRRWYRVQWQC